MKWNRILPWNWKIHNHIHFLAWNAYWTHLGAEYHHVSQGTRTGKMSLVLKGLTSQWEKWKTLTNSIKSHHIRSGRPLTLHSGSFALASLYFVKALCSQGIFNLRLNPVSLTLSLLDLNWTYSQWFYIFLWKMQWFWPSGERLHERYYLESTCSGLMNFNRIENMCLCVCLSTSPSAKTYVCKHHHTL